MRLSEVKNRKGLELLGEIIDPAIRILSDGRVYNNLFGGSIVHAVKWIAKEHSEDAMELLRICSGKKNYSADALTMAQDLVDILTDDDLQTFFKLQSRSISVKSSGSASESTQETEG